MKKPSSYQKMKEKYEAEISRLRSDIDDLIGDDIVKKVAVELKYRLRKDMERQVFSGTVLMYESGFPKPISEFTSFT